MGLKLTTGSGVPARERYSFAVYSPNTISDIAISPEGYAATAEGSNGVKLRELPVGKLVEAFWPSGGLPAQHVAFTADGTKLVALCERTEVVEQKLPKASGKKSTLTPEEKAQFRDELLKARQGTRYKKSVQVAVWDVASRKELGHPVESVTEVEGRLPEYVLSGNGRFVLKTEVIPPQPGDTETGPIPGSVQFTVIDALTGAAGKPVEVRAANTSRTSPHLLSPDGKTIALPYTPTQKLVMFEDVASGKLSTVLGSLRRPIKVLTFSPDGKLVAAATGFEGRQGGGGVGTFGRPSPEDGIAAPTEVVIWDTATGKEVARLVDKESNRDYTAVRFSPDGSFLVAQSGEGGGGGLLTVWGHLPAPEPEGNPWQPPGKGRGPGKADYEGYGPAKGKGGKGKKGPPSAEPPPAAPSAAVPDRFAALFRDLSADGVTDQRRVESLFLAALGRLPTDVESRTLVAQIAKRTDKADALKDLLATLVETAEFKAHAEALGRLAK